MSQIMDAPYIREAELIGYPSEPDIDLMVPVDYMTQAHRMLSQAVSALCRAADLTDGTEYAKVLDGFIERLEDIQSDISLKKDEMQRR